MNNNRKIKILIIILICLVIGFFCAKFIKRNMEISKALENVHATMDDYEKKVSTEYPKFCQNIPLPITGNYTATGDADLELSLRSKNKLFYKMTVNSVLTLNVDSSFDKLEDRERYDILVELNEYAGPAYEAFLKKYFPVFIENPYREEITDFFVSYNYDRPDVYIQTPDHLYQYSRMYEDLYMLDGESYFLMDEDSRWNRKPREDNSFSYSGSGGAGSYSGSGGAGSYSGGYHYTNPEDYADDYYEEYMEDGLDYEDAWEEAYDDW